MVFSYKLRLCNDSTKLFRINILTRERLIACLSFGLQTHPSPICFLYLHPSPTNLQKYACNYYPVKFYLQLQYTTLLLLFLCVCVFF